MRRLSLGEKCNIHQGGVKRIKNECQLMERCDGHGGGVRGWRSVMVIREVFGVWEGETLDRKCDSHWRDVKVLERCVRCDG